MIKRLNQLLLMLTVLVVILTSAISTTPAYADDGTTGEPTPPVNEEVPPAEPPMEEAAPAETVESILEGIPEGTEVVVLNEEGVEPLATQEAAQIILTGDPIWCPSIPSAGGCTPSFGDFASLIAALEADASLPIPSYTGDGVIWVEDTYDGNDDAQIEFNGATLSSLGNLTIQGGWDGGGSGNTPGVSLADASMVFVNWTGNITINNLDIIFDDPLDPDYVYDDAGFGLSITNIGTITLNNVFVSGTELNSFGEGDGAILNSTGAVNITGSEFDNNEGNGLVVETGGPIYLDTVSASGNMLTGAYLDNCLYGSVTSGYCAGSGLVTITSGASTNLFNDNDFAGLVIDAGGGIAMDNVQANDNGLYGAFLTSADADGTGDVIVQESEFSGNSNGTGLDILTDGYIDLSFVDAFSNDTGAVLDTTGGGLIDIDDSDFSLNTWTGLHAESGNTIDLTNVDASFNGTNGAYLEAVGDITVTDSHFDENVQFNYPQDPGLYAKSYGGAITLTNVFADGNDYGAGGVLITKDNGVIDVADSQFNGNGTFGVQAQTQDGDLTLVNITASFNKVKGAYLSSYGLGNIFIDPSTFEENGSYGIYASTSQGNINLDFVTVTGDNGIDDGAVGPDDLTDYGAVLVSGNGGSIFISNSAFDLNTEVGLKIVSSGPVTLTNVTADQNGNNGVEVYSVYTAHPSCPDTAVVNIAVNVDGGTFTNNTNGYGLMVKPGPAGTLVFVNPSTFGGNGLGDYLLDLSGPPASDDCGGKDNPPDSKEPKIVQVPSTGGDPVEQECDLFSSTILELPNGTWVNVGCPFEGFSNLEEVPQANLPGKLGAGTNFAAGINVSLTDGDGNAVIHEDGTITINFMIPKDSRSRGWSILFWDPTLNNGEGGWVEMPLFEAGTSFPLNPDDPNDGRTIISGVRQFGDIVTITVNFPGIFALVAR